MCIQAKQLQVVSECKTQKSRTTDDNQSFVNSYFVSRADSIESKIRSMNKLTKHLSLPRSTRYHLFSKYNTIRKYVINKKSECNVIIGK